MLKLGFRLSICVQHRVFVIPWEKRHSTPRILCSEQRNYSSSGMIKYVPKKSRKISEDFTSQSVTDSDKSIYASRLDHSVLESELKGNSEEAKTGIFLDLPEQNDAGSYMRVSCDEDITSLEKGSNGRRRDRSLLGPGMEGNSKEGIFLDMQERNDSGSYMNEFGDDTCEVEEISNEFGSRGYNLTRKHKQADVKLYVEAGQAKSSKEACKTMEEAEHMAIRYLGLRAYSAAELKKKLVGKKYSLEIVDRVINDFQIRGFINDSLYAESFSRSRWSSLSWGPRRIKQALFKKGISNKDSETAIKLVFEKGQCKEGDEEAEPKHGMSKEAMDQLYVQASKRWIQGRDLPIETRKARVIRWLQYRGFNWGVVALLLKRLESTHES